MGDEYQKQLAVVRTHASEAIHRAYNQRKAALGDRIYDMLDRATRERDFRNIRALEKLLREIDL